MGTKFDGNLIEIMSFYDKVYEQTYRHHSVQHSFYLRSFDIDESQPINCDKQNLVKFVHP